MATIRKRSDKWQVQVRRQGQPPLSRTFTLRADAQTWARQTEADLDKRSMPLNPSQLKKLTVGDIIKRYLETVTPHKRGKDVEAIRLRCLLKCDFTKLSLIHISPETFSRYRDQRLAVVQPGTVLRELSMLQSVFSVALKEWQIPLQHNPIALIRKPSAPPARERRLRNGELEALISECAKCRNQLIKPLILLAIETGMRRGELLRIRWQDIDFDYSTLHIPQTKNGYPRTIPLTKTARALLSDLRRTKTCESAFPMSYEAVKLAWRRLVSRATIEGLHFHDLRHEAISRFFEMGLNMPEVALISGHKDPRMLFRYTHPKVQNIIEKLNNI